MSAETVDEGKLREAATKKDDQSILLQIANKDMVALEVKYHKRCYDKYTSFLRTTTQLKGKETEQHDFKYEKSLDVFCEEFVKEKLIKQENVFYMKIEERGCQDRKTCSKLKMLLQVIEHFD